MAITIIGGYIKMMEFLGKNWIGSLIGLIGIMISAIMSYHFYKKSEQKALPTYQRTTTRIMDIENAVNIDNIEIKYKGKKINRLIRTYIVFWNDGNKTIDGKDILERDRLRCDFGDNEGEILSTNIVKRTRDVNDFDVTVNPENEREILFSFNFLDTKDGALIEVLHTFNGIPRVSGTIKGIPQGIKYNGVCASLVGSRKIRKRKTFINVILRIANSKVVLDLLIIIGLFLICFGLNFERMPKPSYISGQVPDRIMYTFTGIILVVDMSIRLFKESKQRFPKTLMLEDD